MSTLLTLTQRVSGSTAGDQSRATDFWKDFQGAACSIGAPSSLRSPHEPQKQSPAPQTEKRLLPQARGPWSPSPAVSPQGCSPVSVGHLISRPVTLGQHGPVLGLREEHTSVYKQRRLELILRGTQRRKRCETSLPRGTPVLGRPVASLSPLCAAAPSIFGTRGVLGTAGGPVASPGSPVGYQGTIRTICKCPWVRAEVTPWQTPV